MHGTSNKAEINVDAEPPRVEQISSSTPPIHNQTMAATVSPPTNQQQIKTNLKKRTHEEAFPTQISLEPSIDAILGQLKQRVLVGESLNDFKKEVGLLVDLIAKKDPQFDKLADQVGIKLSGVLNKSQQEMIFMLKRNFYTTKKNKLKYEIDKMTALIKQ